ncbi:MAG: hypothetical protein AAF961_14290, partial [Planctomycetota bacterium]
MTDQRGVVHTYTYNERRQLTVDGATTIPGGGTTIDDYVQSIARTYDDRGRVTNVYSYSGSGGSGTVRNRIEYQYRDGAGGNTGAVRLTRERHGSANDFRQVQYLEDDSVSSNVYNDRLRLVQIILYPTPMRVNFRRNPTAGVYIPDNTLDDRLDRVTALMVLPDGGSWEREVEYEYAGADRLVQTHYRVPKVTLPMMGVKGGGPKSYGAWDRFGRRVRTRWADSNGAVTLTDQFDHTYDYAGNRLTRNIVTSVTNYSSDVKDQVYTYDGLQRLKTFDQGTLSGTTISGTPKLQQNWTLDQLGNWEEFEDETNGDGTFDLEQERTHLDANEIDTITASPGTDWADPIYDKAGNMTTSPQPGSLNNSYALKYDAWNRLVEVKNGPTVVQANQYDGLNRRTIRDESGVGGDKRHFFYLMDWQVLEEVNEVSGVIGPDPVAQYVYHPQYIDSIAMRLWDNGSSVVDHYYLQ